MSITYTLAEKNQTAIDPHFGGGIRYTLTLTNKYVNQPSRDDHSSSKMSVDKDTFDSFTIGDSIKVGITLQTVNDGPAPQTEDDLIASLVAQ